MAKSKVTNPTKILFPTLAIAVLGMAAMVGVTSNLQKTLDLSSKASGSSCSSVSHVLDADFVSKHFSKVGNAVGSITAKKDMDKMTIIYDKQTGDKWLGAKYDKSVKGDFSVEVKMHDLQAKGITGFSGLSFWDPVNQTEAVLSIAKQNDMFQVYALHYIAGNYDTRTQTQFKKLKFPVTLKVERKGTKFTYSYKESEGKYQVLRGNDDLTSENMDLRIHSGSRNEYPEVTTYFSDFVLRCN